MKVIIAGDFVPRHKVLEVIEEGNYHLVLGEIKPIMEQVDYSIVNLECPVTKGYERPILKCGPNLQCSASGVAAIKWAGFNCVTLANNHFLDYGDEGVMNTISTCNEYGIDIVGGGMNLNEASTILYKEFNGESLAIINCCEHEFSLATNTSAGSNPLNPIQQYYAVLEARKNADYVVVIVHGGHEHYQLPSLRMQEIYRFFIDTGADAVVNHHQHCYSGFEYYKSKPIFYGLGNFCFYSDTPIPQIWNDGYMVELHLNNDRISSRIIPYCQCKDNTLVHVMKPDAFDNKISELNRIITDSHELLEETEKYYKDSMHIVALAIEPIKNRIVTSLQSRKLLPFLWSKKSLVQLKNYVMCESHRDKMEYFFNHF